MSNRTISETVFASANSEVQSAVYSRYSSPLTPGSVSRALPTQHPYFRVQGHCGMSVETSRYLYEVSEVVKAMHSRRDSDENDGRPESGSPDNPLRPRGGYS